MREGSLVFERELRKDKISGWRWLLGAWGVGTYRQDDSVDVRYEAARRLAAGGRGARDRGRLGSRPASHGLVSFSALRIARVAGERLSV